MILKPASRYRGVRKVERRLGNIAAATATAIARHDGRQDDWIALHGAAEALRARLRDMVPHWQREFRDGRIAFLCLGVSALIVIAMMLAFVVRFRDAWPVLLVELTGPFLAASVHEGQRIRIWLRPIRKELARLERQARATGLALKRAGSGPAPPSAARRTRRWR